MQLVGLGAPPISIIAQLSGGLTVWQMLISLLFAAALFYLGRMLEGYSAD